MQDGIAGRRGIKLVALSEAIFTKIIFRAEQGKALPGPPTCFMGDEGVLGGQVANTIGIHQKTLHFPFQPFMMLILLLMQRHQKLMVIEDT